VCAKLVFYKNRICDVYKKRLTMVLTMNAELDVSSMLYIRNLVQTFSNVICHMHMKAISGVSCSLNLILILFIRKFPESGRRLSIIKF